MELGGIKHIASIIPMPLHHEALHAVIDFKVCQQVRARSFLCSTGLYQPLPPIRRLLSLYFHRFAWFGRGHATMNVSKAKRLWFANCSGCYFLCGHTNGVVAGHPCFHYRIDKSSVPYHNNYRCRFGAQT